MDEPWYDLTDPLDPLNQNHAFFWSDWDCPHCAADGFRDELVDGRCPLCGSEVEHLS